MHAFIYSFNKTLLSAYYGLSMGLGWSCRKYKEEIRHIPLLQKFEWHGEDEIPASQTAEDPSRRGLGWNETLHKCQMSAQSVMLDPRFLEGAVLRGHCVSSECLVSGTCFIHVNWTALVMPGGWGEGEGYTFLNDPQRRSWGDWPKKMGSAGPHSLLIWSRMNS